MLRNRSSDGDWERPLRREEVASVIEGKAKTPRVPMNIHFWVHPETYTANGDAVRSILSRYPEDLQICPMLMPQPCRMIHPDFPDYRWLNWDEPETHSGGLEERVLMPDWDRLGEVMDHFPDPNFPHLFQNFPPMDERYRLGQWFFCLFERHWSLRGMTNALLDYYLHPR